MHLIEIQFIFQSFILDSVVIASAFVDLLYIGLGLGIVLNTYIRVSSPPKQLGYFPSMETEYNSQEHIGVIFRCIYCCGTLITARFQEDFQSTLKLRYASQCNSHLLLVKVLNIPTPPLFSQKISVLNMSKHYNYILFMIIMLFSVLFVLSV